MKRPDAAAQAFKTLEPELRTALDALTGTDEGDPAATWPVTSKGTTRR